MRIGRITEKNTLKEVLRAARKLLHQARFANATRPHNADETSTLHREGVETITLDPTTDEVIEGRG